MQSLETPIAEREDIWHPPPLNGDAATGDGAARRTRTYTAEESDSEMEANEETPEGVAATRSTLTAYLEPVSFKKFDVIQSMVERFPGVYLFI